MLRRLVSSSATSMWVYFPGERLGSKRKNISHRYRWFLCTLLVCNADSSEFIMPSNESLSYSRELDPTNLAIGSFPLRVASPFVYLLVYENLFFRYSIVYEIQWKHSGLLSSPSSVFSRASLSWEMFADVKNSLEMTCIDWIDFTSVDETELPRQVLQYHVLSFPLSPYFLKE